MNTSNHGLCPVGGAVIRGLRLWPVREAPSWPVPGNLASLGLVGFCRILESHLWPGDLLLKCIDDGREGKEDKARRAYITGQLTLM